MKETALRGLLGTILFSAFAVIAVFFLLNPLVKDTTETIVVNTHKIILTLVGLKDMVVHY